MRSYSVSIVAYALAFTIGCADNGSSTVPDNSGSRVVASGGNGTGGASATGSGFATGGQIALGTGGRAESGGSNTLIATTGGKAASGGNATGGTATGGSTSAGGKAASGGSATGGVATGGSITTGGKAASGGSANGGAATGGSISTGGKAASGGSQNGGVATGGRTAAGGTSASGGNTTLGGSGGFDPCPATGNCEILPLGDSITFGTPTNNGGYRVELFTRAQTDKKHITFVGSQSNGPATVAGVSFPKNNEGHPGWTISQIDGISTISQALKDSPHIVLLHIGTNDMVATTAGAPDRLGQLIDKIVTALPNSLLVVSSIIPLPAAASSVATYNAAVPGVVQQRAAAGKHVLYLDMFKGFSSSWLTDGVHPNDATGYPWMGDTWYESIKQYLH